MKKTLSLITLTFMALPMVASADYSLISNVTIKLSETDDTPTLFDRNSAGVQNKEAPLVDYNYWQVENGDKSIQTWEYGNKYVKSKISNQEILQGLLDDGIIEDESISGWDLVRVDDYLYAVKGKLTDIEAYVNLDSNLDYDTEYYAWDQKGGYVYTDIGENPRKYKVNYLYTEVGTADFDIFGAEDGVLDINLSGSYDYVYKDVVIPAKFDDNDYDTLRSYTFKLSGYDNIDDNFIEGSIDFSLDTFAEEVVFPE